MSETEALHAAEVALAEAMVAVKAAEVGTPADGSVVTPSAVAEVAGSVYLGHVGEPAVEGKDF